ncbi:MAG: hypothetical protein JXR60_01435 [Bacteroidales bacterium]|nr:hypothetical protein [Bacteroidales bacterium]
MKSYIIIGILIMLFVNKGIAQPPEGCSKHREMIKAERVAFITDELSLTVDEAQKFWPIYNDYNKKVEALRVQKHETLYKINSSSSDLKEEDYQALLDKYIYFIDEEVKLEKKYQKDLSKVLSAKKIFLLYKAEKAFKHKLVKELRGRPACVNP